MLLDQLLPAAGVARGLMFIDGRWSPGAAAAVTEVENPANEATIAVVPRGTAADADRALEAARRAQPAWAALPAVERGRLVGALADAVRANSEMLARIVVAEQGKPLDQARGEIGATETFLRYASEMARRIEGDIFPSDSANEEIWIRRVPHGVVVGLTAWNYPSALAARKAGPALTAGIASCSRRMNSRRSRGSPSRPSPRKSVSRRGFSTW